jgi:hypothetical protein
MAHTYKTVAISNLPPKIKKSLDGKSVIPVQLGHSNASVYQVKGLGTEWYLKIERQNEAFTREQLATIAFPIFL